MVPPYKNTHKSTGNMFQSTETCRKTTTPENIPWETAIRKCTIAASLQCAGKTAGRKFTMVASSVRNDKAGLGKFIKVASLQQCLWEHPAASKFLWHGRLGEAHLD